MEATVNLNGRLIPAGEARISILDHGLLYGDGIFETLRAYGGRFFRMDAHLARLRDAAELLELPLPWSDAELAQAIRETVRATGMPDCSVRLTVTRGEGPPLPDPTLCHDPSYFVTVRPAASPDDAAFERGTSVVVTGRHPRPGQPGIKALSYLSFQLARHQARRLGHDEALLTDGDEVVEASASNVFAVREGVLRTPPLESGCLPGVTRAAVLETAASARLLHEEAPVGRAWLGECDEIFLTNSLVEILPVVRLDGAPVGDGAPGPVTRRLRAGLEALVARELSD